MFLLLYGVTAVYFSGVMVRGGGGSEWVVGAGRGAFCAESRYLPAFGAAGY